MSETILDRIVAAAKRRMREAPARRDLEDMARGAVEARRADGLRSLRGALSGKGPHLLAECKHASPSAGVLRDPFDPAALAQAYERAGAAAISVVVEPDYFLGDPAWIQAVRQVVTLPVLRKDFIFCERQLFETAVLGADAVLLIQRLLTPERTGALLGLARELDIDVLLEVFVDEDPEPAVASGCEILGVNARDLATFETRIDKVVALAASLPANRVRVAESGIKDAADVRRLNEAGYGAFLVGETLVRADDPESAARDLMGRS